MSFDATTFAQVSDDQPYDDLTRYEIDIDRAYPATFARMVATVDDAELPEELLSRGGDPRIAPGAHAQTLVNRLKSVSQKANGKLQELFDLTYPIAVSKGAEVLAMRRELLEVVRLWFTWAFEQKARTEGKVGLALHLSTADKLRWKLG